ncbi:sigma-70 family RNA polymerase sigma factor [Lutispora saccharofermentans]|uniref:Sigma-70 family RNA polymerase sigma factor n=1 Tax=Lutispora saccharofermentans TaxID=3024236 RepID=A0ABT1NCH3_9FIRM|nr:sigma-70 family RNA polymerase sigma factor [Lutispora saccharofermentans]MCQ1528836.1 sigma-70 family RNA polymerase sigma factor [Lutispora saccharofermentans]
MNQDKEIVAYIARGIKNEYIRLSRKNSLICKNEIPILEDMQITDEDRQDSIELRIEIQSALLQLTPLQRKIIEEIIIKDRKEKDVAKELEITRQAVNKAKKYALRKLRSLLLDALT